MAIILLNLLTLLCWTYALLPVLGALGVVISRKMKRGR